MKIKYIQGRKWKMNLRSDERWHLIRNLVTQLVTHERIKTTSAKAKHMTPTVERLIALGKKVVFENKQHLVKDINRTLTTEQARKKFYEELIPRLKEVQGQQTRRVYLKNRKGDNAPVSYIEIKQKYTYQ